MKVLLREPVDVAKVLQRCTNRISLRLILEFDVHSPYTGGKIVVQLVDTAPGSDALVNLACPQRGGKPKSV